MITRAALNWVATCKKGDTDSTKLNVYIISQNSMKTVFLKLGKLQNYSFYDFLRLNITIDLLQIFLRVLEVDALFRAFDFIAR